MANSTAQQREPHVEDFTPVTTEESQVPDGVRILNLNSFRGSENVSFGWSLKGLCFPLHDEKVFGKTNRSGDSLAG
jgi:hypothetical protein